MTTYRLFPATNGPSSPVSYSGNILTGVLFKVTTGGMWFNGYYKWVATGEDVTARKFALWTLTGSGAASLISAATVTSGTLTAGQWNFVPLATPVPLAIGTTYNATTGWSAVSGHGFSDSDTSGAGTGSADSYGAGGHTAGITQGPLFAYSDIGGSAAPPYSFNQGLFGVAGTDATVNMPGSGSNSGNFWMDVQVSDTGPAGYSGSYRLWPNKVDANSATVQDSSVNYVLATEFHLSQACTLNKIWYYSPAGTAQLATSADIWSIQGANSGTKVASNASPSWSGAAASGWVSCSFSGVTLPAGSYKVSVFNGNVTPDGWGAKDANTAYWATGDGANGITWGPLSAPGLSGASVAYKFNSGGGGNSPPFSDGLGTTEAAQCTFAQSGTNIYPYLYVDALAQNYWVDVEVTPSSAPSPPLPQLMPPGLSSPAAWQRPRYARLGQTVTIAGSGGVVLPKPALSGAGSVGARIAFPASPLMPPGLSSPAAWQRPRYPRLGQTVTIAGSGGVVLPKPALSGSGLLTVTGSGGVVLPKPALSLSGSVAAAAGIARPPLMPPGLSSPAAWQHPRYARVPMVAFTGITGTGGVVLPKPSLALASPPPVTETSRQGGWWQLHSIYEQAKQEREFWDSQPAMACPRCGEPMRPAPSDSGAGTELYCRFDGFRYPDDWDSATMSGM